MSDKNTAITEVTAAKIGEAQSIQADAADASVNTHLQTWLNPIIQNAEDLGQLVRAEAYLRGWPVPAEVAQLAEGVQRLKDLRQNLRTVVLEVRAIADKAALNQIPVAG